MGMPCDLLLKICIQDIKKVLSNKYKNDDNSFSHIACLKQYLNMNVGLLVKIPSIKGLRRRISCNCYIIYYYYVAMLSLHFSLKKRAILCEKKNDYQERIIHFMSLYRHWLITFGVFPLTGFSQTFTIDYTKKKKKISHFMNIY